MCAKLGLWTKKKKRGTGNLFDFFSIFIICFMTLLHSLLSLNINSDDEDNAASWFATQRRLHVRLNHVKSG